jgi:hypothetical protein
MVVGCANVEEVGKEGGSEGGKAHYITGRHIHCYKVKSIDIAIPLQVSGVLMCNRWPQPASQLAKHI